MEILQEIGAYAGLASVVGLAVLSALYFSQARDVKRLREWAGRAPERAAEPGRAAPAPAPRVVPKPRPAQAGAQAQKGAPAPAKPRPAPAQAAAGATRATAKPGAATPAGQRQGPPPAEKEAKPAERPDGAPAEPEKVPLAAQAADGDEDKKEGAKAPEEEKVAAPTAAGEGASAPPAETGAPVAQAGAAAPPKPGEEAAAGAPPATEPGVPGPEAPPAGPPGGAPPRPVPPVRRTPPPRRPPVRGPATAGAGSRGRIPSRPSQTAVIPPSEVEARRPLYRRVLADPRHLVLTLAGILIVGGGAAFGLAQLAEEEAPQPSAERELENGDSGRSARKKAPPVNPADVTVSVLNGTTVPGLAAQVGDKVESFGFQLGNVTNNPDQQRAESVVLYAPDHEREATAVGRKLGVGQREPIDPSSQALGGDASVIVVAGSDQTQ